MASTRRRSARDLVEEIRALGFRFDFFQAVRLLGLSSRRTRPHPLPSSLRFSTPATLGFPASEIVDVRERTDAGAPAPDTGPVQEHAEPAFDITITFLGLTGPSGVLPTAYTELLAERRNLYRDTAAHRFLDLFSHRAASLFYQAWQKHRFYLAYEAGEDDGFTRNLLDVVGAGLASLRGRLLTDAEGVPDIALAHFAGLLSRKPVSATSMRAVLRGYFGVDVEVEQFVGQWIAIPHAEQSCLGSHACELGESAFTGSRAWDRQTKIRIAVGPLDQQQLSDFLPGAKAAASLAELVRFCVGSTLACDVRLVLKREHVSPPRIAGTGPAIRLGYDGWLATKPLDADPNDVCFSLQ
jgi:type VI secretion system protein ImpH